MVIYKEYIVQKIEVNILTFGADCILQWLRDKKENRGMSYYCLLKYL